MVLRPNFSIVLVLCSLAIGCHEGPPPEANCRIDKNYVNSANTGGACIITVNQRLLVLADINGKFDIPKRVKNNQSNAQCSAHNSVWKDTGLNVEVGRRIGQINDNLWLFACKLEAGFDGSEEFSTPRWSASNAIKIKFINPFEHSAYDWTDPDQYISILDGFVIENGEKGLMHLSENQPQ